MSTIVVPYTIYLLFIDKRTSRSYFGSEIKQEYANVLIEMKESFASHGGLILIDSEDYSWMLLMLFNE
ncbi:hypothetical protein KM043_011894 [Ampulex compressa]|nr:hypothetical protein KM043_011894 [Ampulex compressa]